MEAYSEITVPVPQQTLRYGLQRYIKYSHHLPANNTRHSILLSSLSSPMLTMTYSRSSSSRPNSTGFSFSAHLRLCCCMSFIVAAEGSDVLRHKCWRAVGSRIPINGCRRVMQQSLSFPGAIACYKDPQERS